MNKETVKETPVFELYKAGVVFEKSLGTLVREAAMGAATLGSLRSRGLWCTAAAPSIAAEARSEDNPLQLEVEDGSNRIVVLVGRQDGGAEGTRRERDQHVIDQRGSAHLTPRLTEPPQRSSGMVEETGSYRGGPSGGSSKRIVEAADRLDAPVDLQDRLLAEDEIERPLDRLLLRLRAEELLGTINLGLIQFEVLVPRHVHDSG
ncbi:hypothetical protein WME75_16640 [Sorangium sp. So ce1014]|uniref:hypothetical protein n=1 Tax=Sorangium sp. So ce1014 TaxID=3133326 RepID=UPI003F63BAF4